MTRDALSAQVEQPVLVHGWGFLLTVEQVFSGSVVQLQTLFHLKSGLPFKVKDGHSRQGQFFDEIRKLLFRVIPDDDPVAGFGIEPVECSGDLVGSHGDQSSLVP